MFAHGEQIPHLQTEKYFLPGTRPGKKWIAFDLPPAGGKLCEAFWDKLHPPGGRFRRGLFCVAAIKNCQRAKKICSRGIVFFFTFYYNKFKKRPLPVCQWLLTDF
ncbi:MAG: hypothetical protein ACLT21_03635 [Oscillospiraceae bacterium]